MVDAEAWLYKSHCREELRRWANGLRFFRFCRAYGGHANDGDSFLAALRFDSEDELLELYRHLGIVLSPLPADEPRPEPGRRYGGADFARFRSAIAAFPRWLQPGPCEVRGVPVLVWAGDAALRLRLYGAEGNEYDVGETDFDGARKIEVVLEPIASRVIDPPQNDRYCVCPRYHPEVFRTGTRGGPTG